MRLKTQRNKQLNGHISLSNVINYMLTAPSNYRSVSIIDCMKMDRMTAPQK